MAVRALKIHKPYPKPCCPHCGRVLKPLQLKTGHIVCPSCGSDYDAVVFTPPPEAMTVRRLGTVTQISEEAGVAAEAPCAHHVLNAAEVHCERCGSFICALCRIDLGGQAFCPACFERILADGSEEFGPERTTYDRGIARIAGVLGLIPFFGLLMGPLAFIYSIKSILQWRAGKAAAGGLLGLIFILLLALADIAGNFWFVGWIALRAIYHSRR